MNTSFHIAILNGTCSICFAKLRQVLGTECCYTKYFIDRISEFFSMVALPCLPYSCISHAQVLGKTLVHEFHIFFGDTEYIYGEASAHKK